MNRSKSTLECAVEIHPFSMEVPGFGGCELL